jgi:hypothetical protein
MPANYVLLAEQTVSAPVASVTFSNIPQTGYSDLKIQYSTRTTAAAYNDGVLTQINGSSSNFTFRQIYGTGSGGGASNSGSTNAGANTTGATATANTFGSAELYIANYTSSNAKAMYVDSVGENNSSSSVQAMLASLWNQTAAITSVGFVSSSGANFVAGSSFSLYGIAATGTTPAIYAKATGGDIITNDGTYWYHAFLSSGIFTPSQALSCDTLVVAGGGGGGGATGTGGGAGGLSYQSSRSAVALTSYVVTIGAGGAGGGSFGIPGSNSVFDTITSNGGGRGGFGGSSGGNGGSGGGAGDSAPSSPGTATQGNTGGATGYGNNGGNAVAPALYGQGGGGGAGAAGGNGTTSVGGNGGVGLSGTTIAALNAMGAATKTGQLVSGNYFYAGGGGGGVNTSSASTGGNGGGGNGNNGGGNGNGTANTGGGGGGCNGGGFAVSSGAGGSGIVIVRYPVA